MAKHNKHNDTTVGTTGGTRASGSALVRLKEQSDFEVADGYPDIRGWDIKTRDGTRIGEVKDLVVDTQAMRARYVDVELDRSVGQLARDAATPGDQSDHRHVLLPIGPLQLDDTHDDVRVDGYTAAQIAALPRYDGQAITGEYERTLRGGLLGGTAGATAAGAATMGTAATRPSGTTADDRFDYDADLHRDHYDDQRLYASRRSRGISAAGTAANATDEARMTVAHEELAVGKRQVQAGEATLRKTVETEHVRENVPLMHEEVTVERHPLTGEEARAAAAGTLGTHVGEEGEIRVPVMREEAVVQTRVVPREEIIVRKRMVTEQQTVEADLRREHVEVERGDAVAGGTAGATTSGATDRATSTGLGDRIADAVDNVKDRLDGNPASKPGPDPTDRRI